MYTIEIKQFDLLEQQHSQLLLELYQQIPEFDRDLSHQTLMDKLGNQPHLLLLAYVEGELAGFKLGYQLNNEVFYSYLGAIHPEFRQLGLAQQLLSAQEQWAVNQGYRHMQVKTFNHFRGMLNLLIKNEYQIAALNQAEDLSKHELTLTKQILRAA